MNMEGMSEATLEKFIGSGFIHEFADIFRLSRYKDAIVEMEGFGEKSYEKLMAGIGQARNTTLPAAADLQPWNPEHRRCKCEDDL